MTTAEISEYPFVAPLYFPRNIIIWPPADIHPSVDLGDGVVIGRFTNICDDVRIEGGTRIQGFCFIPGGVRIGRNVFIGPNVVFTNMKRPNIIGKRQQRVITIVEDDAVIGAGAIICPGVNIGEGALIGAGAVVTKDVIAGETVVGFPARRQ